MGGALKHNDRENYDEIENANPELSDQNEVLIGAGDAKKDYAKYKELLPEKNRKNAVYGIEVMMTASPELFEDMPKSKQDIYFKKSLEFAQDTFGKENIISAMVHRDERTPHLHVVLIPLKDDKLNAKHYLGGSKYRMSELQDQYFERVKGFDLERGTKGSKATHERVGEFYKHLDGEPSELIRPDELKPKKISTFKKETPEQVAKRLNRKLEKMNRAVKDQAQHIRKEKFNKSRADNSIDKLMQDSRNERALKYDKLVKDLPENYVNALTKASNQLRERSQAELSKTNKNDRGGRG